jgi:hypothetical protein
MFFRRDESVSNSRIDTYPIWNRNMSEWTIEAKLKGEFSISQNENISGAGPLVPGLRKLRITPAYNEGKPTGIHDLEAVLEIEVDPAAPNCAEVVFARMTDLLSAVRAIVALSTGRKVELANGYTGKIELSREPQTYLCVIGGVGYAEISPLVALASPVFSKPIDSKVLRAIAWWSRGLPPGDTVDRLIALNSSLDMTAGLFGLGKSKIKLCKACGDKQDIGPGVRENVLAFLHQQGLPDKEAAGIYGARNELAHGFSHLSQEDELRYERYCNVLMSVIHKGIAQLIGVKLQSPETTMFHGRSAFLVINYTLPQPTDLQIP